MYMPGYTGSLNKTKSQEFGKGLIGLKGVLTRMKGDKRLWEKNVWNTSYSSMKLPENKIKE